MSVMKAFLGISHEVVGCEDDPGGGLRLYVDARYLHRYFVVPEGQEEAAEQDWRASFRSHLFIDPVFLAVPPACHARLPGHEDGFHERNVRR